MNVTGLHWWSVNIGSGNGLVPSGTKPLPEPMLTQISRYGVTRPQWVNSLVPERCDNKVKNLIFKLLLQIDIIDISQEIALR